MKKNPPWGKLALLHNGGEIIGHSSKLVKFKNGKVEIIRK